MLNPQIYEFSSFGFIMIPSLHNLAHYFHLFGSIATPIHLHPGRRKTHPWTSPDAIKLPCLVTATSTTGTVGTARLSRDCSVKPGLKNCQQLMFDGF